MHHYSSSASSFIVNAWRDSYKESHAKKYLWSRSIHNLELELRKTIYLVNKLKMILFNDNIDVQIIGLIIMKEKYFGSKIASFAI